MLEEKPSAAAVGPEAAPKSSGAPPGGTLPAAKDAAADPLPTRCAGAPCPAVDQTPGRQFTLQYLIAVIKKVSK